MTKRVAGSLTRFMRELEKGLKTGSVSVPCGSCTACCRDPVFEVDVGPDEVAKYSATRVKYGRNVLDKQANGHCVYLVDDKCSVYHDRPRTCRSYDCRYHMLGAPLSKEATVMQEAIHEWENWRLPTTEDKIMLVALTLLVRQAQLRDPNLVGLAHMLLKWKDYRAQAYPIVQEAVRL